MINIDLHAKYGGFEEKLISSLFDQTAGDFLAE
jgi:hypothetical protein